MTPRDEVVLVTGGAVRVGAAIVEALVAAGWRVAFSWRSSGDEAERLARRLGDRVAPLRADLDAGADRAALLEGALERFGRLDGLVLNAATFPRTPLDELDATRFHGVLRTDLVAPVLLATEAAAELRRRAGAIVTLLDAHTHRPLRDHLAYLAAKAGLEAATRALALEFAPDVRVNAVAPGVALFPDDMGAAQRRRYLERIPAGRVGGGGDVAETVRFLLDAPPTLTGQVVTVDGGLSLPLV